MKKTAVLIITAIVTGCGSGVDTPTQEDINNRYLSQAETYFTANIAKDIEKEEAEVLAFDNLKIDSVFALSSYHVEEFKWTPLIREYNLQAQFAIDLVDIDKQFGSEISDKTLIELQKSDDMNDSLYALRAAADRLDKTDTLGYGVVYVIDLTMKDGTKSKGQQMVLYFDKENDLKSEWNP